MLKTHYLDVKIRGLPQGNWRNWSGAKPVVGPTDRMVCGSAGWSGSLRSSAVQTLLDPKTAWQGLLVVRVQTCSFSCFLRPLSASREAAKPSPSRPSLSGGLECNTFIFTTPFSVKGYNLSGRCILSCNR